MPKLQGVDAGEERRHPAARQGGGRREPHVRCPSCRLAKPRAVGAACHPLSCHSPCLPAPLTNVGSCEPTRRWAPSQMQQCLCSARILSHLLHWKPKGRAVSVPSASSDHLALEAACATARELLAPAGRAIGRPCAPTCTYPLLLSRPPGLRALLHGDASSPDPSVHRKPALAYVHKGKEQSREHTCRGTCAASPGTLLSEGRKRDSASLFAYRWNKSES